MISLKNPTVWLRDAVLTSLIIGLSIFTFPISLFFCGFPALFRCYETAKCYRQQCRSAPNFREYTVLITGVGMAKGLTLARAFFLTGHRVIGADIETAAIACPGRSSRAIHVFYGLKTVSTEHAPVSYAENLLEIVQRENVKLWVSCSGVATALDDATAKEIIEKHTTCRCIQFDRKTTALLHKKDEFMRHAKLLGLPVPETHDVSSVDAAFDFLSGDNLDRTDRRYILKPVDMDDAYRGDMTLLPLDTDLRTMHHLQQFPISSSRGWILQQYIPGGREYCTHALIVRGEVKVFVACRSAELLMHYKALSDADPLSKLMLDLTRDFATRCGSGEPITGHLSLDFMAEEVVTENGVQTRLFAIECNPRAHTAVVLFAQMNQRLRGMTDAYFSAAKEAAMPNFVSAASSHISNGVADYGGESRAKAYPITPSVTVLPRYWLAHDLITLVLLPSWHLLTLRAPPHKVYEAISSFIVHTVSWKEGTFESWDPWPSMHLHHFYWPRKVFEAWWAGKRWSRINVSTTKMFAC